MKTTIEDIKQKMIKLNDKLGLSIINTIENFVQTEQTTISKAITYYLSIKSITGYKRQILNILRITYPYDGEFEKENKSKLTILNESIDDFDNSFKNNITTVETTLPERISHTEDNEIHNIGTSQSAVFSVYQNKEEETIQKPERKKRIKKSETSQEITDEQNNSSQEITINS